MKQRQGMILTFLVFFALIFICASESFATEQSIENERYRVCVLDDGSVDIVVEGAKPVRFEPHFTILCSENKISQSSERISNPYYRVISWQRSDSKEKTKDLFKAAEVKTIRATASKTTDEMVYWTFPENQQFSLEAELIIPTGKGEPKIHFSFTPKKSGWYSVGYTGAPSLGLDRVESIWQPLMWGDKRLPDESYITEEARCSIPATIVTAEGQSYSVLADPAKLPFRMPNGKNDLFGVAVRNAAGECQPMVFAPLLAGAGSKMQAGESFDFNLALLVYKGDSDGTFEYIARHILNFSDIRVNSLCSLNTTFENMIEFAMSTCGRFNFKYRGSAYDADVPGAVKNVSSLHPLGVSIVTDDEDIFLKRVLPITEYVLSREKFLFKAGEKSSQGSSNKMTGPCAPVSELASLYSISKGSSPVFLNYVKSLYDVDRTLNMDWVTMGSTWQRSLAMYRATGEKKYLDDATKKADIYIDERVNKPQYDFSEAGTGTFWEYMFPAWKDLLELYEETGRKEHLEAAVKGARQYASLVWFYPAIPDEYILVNKGGMAPTRGYGNAPPIEVAEEIVPAWRVSDVGLVCEGNGTAARLGIFLATHAPYFLRLAHYADDDFLRDIARSAIIGRYASFPGYHMNTEYTTVYEKPWFPYRPLKAFTITSMHYNHIWPQIAFVLDYLIADAFDRSEGNIDFPSQYAEGYAYLQGKVYGDRAGKFYDQKNVWLWMPPELLYVDNVQVNYIAARGNGNLYFALSNQCDKDIETDIILNDKLVPVDKDKKYQVTVIKDNKPAEPLTLENGTVKVSISSKGITALIIEGLEVTPKFQSKILTASTRKVSEQSYKTIDTPFGKVKGMILSFGRFVWFYGYLEADAEQLKGATLVYSDGKAQQKMTDSEFPFEFTVPIVDDADSFIYYIEGIKPDGSKVASEKTTLTLYEN